jgi:uncharacterized protein
MGMTELTVGPIEQSARISSLDILRGLAALGILLMNIPVMGGSWKWSLPPLPARFDVDWIAFCLQDVGVQGSMRGLFTLLFGAGMMVMLTRPDPAREAAAVQAYFTRCFALMLLGVINFALFLWPGEILFNYGVSGMVLFLFRKAEPRLLTIAATTMMVMMTLGYTVSFGDKLDMMQRAEAAAALKVQGHRLSPEQARAVSDREAAIAAVLSPQARAAERRARSSLATLPGWSMKTWLDYNMDGFRSILGVVESVTFMLVGILLFRAGVLTGQRTARFYGWLAIGGLVPGLMLRGGMEVLRWRAGFLPDASVLIGELLFYEVGRLAMTLGVLGLVMVLFQAGWLRVVGGVLAAVGRMALTTYIGQSIITAVIFYAAGFYGELGFARLMGLAMLIWIAQGAFSVLWLRFFEMGPAEWLLRWVTYGQMRRLRRQALTPLAGLAVQP